MKGLLAPDPEQVREQYPEEKQQGDAAEQQPDKVCFPLFVAIGDAVISDETRDQQENNIEHRFATVMTYPFIVEFT